MDDTSDVAANSLALQRGDGALHISPLAVVAVLATAGWTLGIAAEFTAQPIQVAMYALLLLILAGGDWLLFRERPDAACWFGVTALATAVFLAYGWLGVRDILPLLAVPAALATALIGLPATLIVALAEMALLLCYRWSAPADLGWASAGVALLSIAATAATVYAICQPVEQLERWLRDYFQRAQDALEEARDRRAELEQALADLAQANRQLALANERMAAMRSLAEEAQKSKAAFVAKVSHEFRTPLNMIIGLVALLTESPNVYGRQLPAELFEDLKIVRRNCEHLSGLVTDVLDLSQAEAGRLALRKERVNLAEIVEEALDVVRALLDKKHLRSEVQVPADLPLVYCDRRRIRQVILNLVSNAARFTDRGGIQVRVQPQGDLVAVSVIDTGPGILPEDLERIFEPFSQGSGELGGDRGGSGLGLSISKQFIEMHGGHIWIESQFGAGTTISFDVPISPPLAPPSTPSRWISEDWVWRERAEWPKLPDLPMVPRIVVCDATRELYPVLAHYSTEAEFIDVPDLDQACEALAECPAHVLLLNTACEDELWPLVEQARSRAGDTPIAGCCIPPYRTRVTAAGAADYLVRPVTQQSLRKAIGELGRPVRRILIVDDDPDVRQLLTRMLSAGPDLDIITASNGSQALEELYAGQPDLMLMDIIMPGMDGWQLLKLKNEDEAIRDIPVIVVSAQDRPEHPPGSAVMVATMGEGLPMGKLLQCSLKFSALMLRAE